eukprot:1181785-Prorocentrum_minimum.AAC.2
MCRGAPGVASPGVIECAVGFPGVTKRASGPPGLWIPLVPVSPALAKQTPHTSLSRHDTDFRLELVKLVDRMLSPDPTKRPTAAAISELPWLRSYVQKDHPRFVRECTHSYPSADEEGDIIG